MDAVEAAKTSLLLAQTQFERTPTELGEQILIEQMGRWIALVINKEYLKYHPEEIADGH